MLGVCVGQGGGEMGFRVVGPGVGKLFSFGAARVWNGIN